jgi:hypothetical protein
VGSNSKFNFPVFDFTGRFQGVAYFQNNENLRLALEQRHVLLPDLLDRIYPVLHRDILARC